MPPLLLKAQPAAHPLLFISHPLLGPQPQPQNQAKQPRKPPWPRVSPCPTHVWGPAAGPASPGQARPQTLLLPELA